MKQNKIIIEKDNFELALKEYIQSKEALDQFITTKASVEDKKPSEKRIFDTVEDYNNHLLELEAYEAFAAEWNTNYDQHEKRLKEAELSLFKILPRNIWIGTIYDNSPLWVGYSTTNWGGGTRAIITSKTKPNSPLEHIYYN